MSLKERLNEDLKTAMRAKDSVRLVVIRGIKAAVLAAETRGSRSELDDDEVLQVIAKEAKEREEVLPEFEQAGRTDLVAKTRAELAVLKEYLPPPLDGAALDALIQEAVAATGAAGPRDLGKVMGWLMPKVRGRADGGDLSARVRAALGS